MLVRISGNIHSDGCHMLTRIDTAKISIKHINFYRVTWVHMDLPKVQYKRPFDDFFACENPHFCCENPHFRQDFVEKKITKTYSQFSQQHARNNLNAKSYA